MGTETVIIRRSARPSVGKSYAWLGLMLHSNGAAPQIKDLKFLA